MNQSDFYEAKLKYEIDAWNLYKALSNGDDIVVIDTRSSEAYEIESIPSSINISHITMTPENIRQLNKAILYVVYCDGIGSNASTRGALNMARFGFQVKELIGGLDWWKRDGYATTGTDGHDGREVICSVSVNGNP
ncbi:rhodanese-like domain-containing protein [Pseudomonadota bacterium]